MGDRFSFGDGSTLPGEQQPGNVVNTVGTTMAQPAKQLVDPLDDRSLIAIFYIGRAADSRSQVLLTMLTLARLFGLIAAAGTPLRAPATAAQKTTVSNAAVRPIVVIALQGGERRKIRGRAASLNLAAAMQLRQRTAHLPYRADRLRYRHTSVEWLPSRLRIIN